MGHLVDTDVLIDISKGNENALLFLTNLGSANISIITSMELIVGAKNKIEVQEIEKFLQSYSISSLDNKICSKAYNLLKEYSLTHGLTIADSLIAATAIVNNISLVTKNVRHFKPIKELKLKVPDY